MKSSLLIVPTLFSSLLTIAQQLVNVEKLVINPYKTFAASDTNSRRQIVAWCEFQHTNPDYKKITAQASSVYFPGTVKPGAEKIQKVITITHKQIPDEQMPIVSRLVFSAPMDNTLYSTGLYAVAGEVFEVNVPEALLTKEIYVQVGAHSDNLGYWMAANENWRRMPDIIKEIKLTKKQTKIASPFGGLIYITCKPTVADWKSDISINGAISSPQYIKGQTSLDDWQQQLAQNKAPWGELHADNIIITLPDSVLQRVKSPDSVTALWDLIVGGEMELAQLPEKLYRPQRMVIDEHLGGGYAHSGYPFMVHHSPSTHMLSTDVVADPARLLQPSEGGANWGFFHEIGHNLQNYDWVFDGTTEVSCNFFSLYMFDRLTGGRDGAHSNINNAHTTRLMKLYFEYGARYDDWKEEPFLGLILFRQLQEAFGWEAFKAFFRKAQQDAAGDPLYEKQLSEAAKRDKWVKDFSDITHHNLAPFFEKWGIPISDSVKALVKQYPGWMPYNFPPQP